MNLHQQLPFTDLGVLLKFGLGIPEVRFCFDIYSCLFVDH